MWVLTVLAGGGAVTVGAALVITDLFLNYSVVRVFGQSMLPAVSPGDRLVIRRTRYSRLRVGMIAVVRPPGDEPPRAGKPRRRTVRLTGEPFAFAVKRVCAIAGDQIPDAMRTAARGMDVVPPRMLLVSADNPLGNDSRQWGLVSEDRVLGTMVRNLGVPKPAKET
jgi:signal peptidase I